MDSCQLRSNLKLVHLDYMMAYLVTLQMDVLACYYNVRQLLSLVEMGRVWVSNATVVVSVQYVS